MRQLGNDRGNQAFLPALIIASMAMLFPIAVPIGDFVGVPLIVIAPVFILLQKRSHSVVLYSLFFCTPILIVLLFFQILSNPGFENFRETLIVTCLIIILIPLCVGVIHVAQKESKFIEQLIDIIYIILILYILAMTSQLLFTDQISSLLGDLHNRPNYLHYKHYFLPIIRPPGIAQEPSHLALAMALPIFISILYGHYISKKRNSHFRKFLTLICVICPSLTMILIIAFALFFNFLINSKKNILHLIFRFLFVIAFSISVYYIFTVNVTTENRENPILTRIVHTRDLLLGRLSVVSTESSSSATFFYKGFELARVSLENYPFGVGINNLQTNNDLSRVSKLSRDYRDRHSRDGSSFLFKFIGEFGYFAVIIIVMMAIIIFKNVFLEKKRKSVKLFLRILLTYCFLCYWVRGMGYFDGLAIFVFSFLLYDTIIRLKYNSRSTPKRRYNQKGNYSPPLWRHDT